MVVEPDKAHGVRAAATPNIPAPPGAPAPGDTPAALAVASEACEAVVMLSGPEGRLLAALPDPGQPVPEQLWCDLEDGHEGLHWALGQLSGADWWWLRWDDTGARRELVERAVCAQTAGPDEPGERDVPCALPVEHAGAHGYTRPT